MTDLIAKGTWVDVHRVVLAPGERAPQVPGDTLQVPLEMRVKGVLAEDGARGDEVEVVTQTGRRLRGTLVASNPAYTHGFGQPVPELVPIGAEVRAILRERGGHE